MELDEVYEEIRRDKRWDHLRAPGIVLVPGRGNAVDPIAMIVGEGPGATENTKRRPFCGPSGRVLKGLMASADLYAEDDACLGCDTPHAQYDCPHRTDIRANAFITNVLKYRPPGNRTPNAREVHFGAEALRKEWMAIGRPPLIVAVGAPARAALAPAELRLKPGQVTRLRDNRTYVYIQYHPAWAMRKGQAEKDLIEEQWTEMGQWLRSTELL